MDRFSATVSVLVRPETTATVAGNVDCSSELLLPYPAKNWSSSNIGLIVPHYIRGIVFTIIAKCRPA